MPTEHDKHIFQCFMALETALSQPDYRANPSAIADAINRLINAHVQRAVSNINARS